MFFVEIPRHTRQNAISTGDLECILTRNCEDTEQLRNSFLFVKDYKNKWRLFYDTY